MDFYIITINVKVKAIKTIPIIPYFMNFPNDILISCCLIKLINIIPASEPSGVSNAQRLDEAITA